MVRHCVFDVKTTRRMKLVEISRVCRQTRFRGLPSIYDRQYVRFSMLDCHPTYHKLYQTFSINVHLPQNCPKSDAT
jgi:hypothetical protein